MRKSLIAFGLLLLCASLFLGAAMTAVDSGKDQIVVTETTLTGDASAAAGLRIEQFQNRNSTLFWHTSYEASAEPEAVTEFEFGQSKHEQEIRIPNHYVELRPASMNFGMSGNIDLEKERGSMDGLDSESLTMVRDVASRTPPGETCTEILKLKDYFERYPIGLSSNLYGTLVHDEIYAQQCAFLETYFSFPIGEQEQLEVTVSRDSRGQIYDVNCHQYIPEDQDPKFMNIYSDSVVVEDHIYLLLRGNMEVSQIRDGYGIYRIPITEVQQIGEYSFQYPQTHFAVEEIANVYPLPKSCRETVRLLQSPQDGELLLFETGEETVTLRILDSRDLTVKQSLDLGRTEVPILWQCEDLLVCVYELYTEDAVLQVWQPGADGYTLWLETDLYPLYEVGWYNEPVLAFDGQRLAVAALWEYYRSASFRVSVYDSTGVIYAGDYAINSDTLPAENSLESYNWVEPLQIHWN